MNTLQTLLALAASIIICVVLFAPKGKHEGQTNPITFGAISFCLFGIFAILMTFVLHYLILKGHKSVHSDIVFYLLLLCSLTTGVFVLVPTKVGSEEKKDSEAGKDDNKNVLHVATISILGQPISRLVISQGWTLLIKGVMSPSLIKSDWDVLTLTIEMISRDNAPFSCEVSFRYRIADFYVAIFENGIGTVMKTLEDTVEACLTAFARSLEAEILTKLSRNEKIHFIENFLQPDLEDAAERLGIEIEIVSKTSREVVLRMDDFVCTNEEFKAALMLGAVTKRAMEAVNTKTDEFEKLFARFFKLYNAKMTPGDAARNARNDAMLQLGIIEEKVFKGLGGGGAIVEAGDGTAVGTSGGKKKRKK